MGNYAVCGQYQGAVGLGTTVTLNCTCGLEAYRYLIVQFPIQHVANFCELEVYIRRKLLCEHRVACEIVVRNIQEADCEGVSYLFVCCLGGAAVRHRTRDRKVAGSTPDLGAIKSTTWSTQPSIPPG